LTSLAIAADSGTQARPDKRLRRVKVVWALLFLNVLAFAKAPMVIAIPHKYGQLLTQGSLIAALVVAFTINRKGSIRPNLFLFLYTLLGITTFMMSIRLVGLGTTYRGFRLVLFLAVLWLLTPWWRDRGLILLRSQIRFLQLILASLVLGLFVAPGKAMALNYGGARLTGVIWPIPPPQVAHYMAELTGLTILLWLCGIVARRQALVIIVPAFLALVATHTRTALIGMMLGVVVAALSLVISSRRVRRVFGITLVVLVTVILPLSPVISSWLVRGQSSSELTHLSGRTKVWPLVLSESRPETNKIFGSGLTNDSLMNSSPTMNGLPIDSSWLATFQNQGIAGWLLEGAMFLVLILTAVLRPRGPTRALALFFIVYCLFSSFTESGMGEPSSYLLDLTIAASLLVPRSIQGLNGPMRRVSRSFSRLRIPRGLARPAGRRPLPTGVVPISAGLDGIALGGAVALGGRGPATTGSHTRQAARRLGWGVADQAISSLTNFAVNIYIVRDLGAVQYGAFALAYVTYGFVLQASRGLATDPLLVRFSATDVRTWRRAVASSSGTALAVGMLASVGTLVGALLMHGPTRLAFLALAFTLPALMLQDSWRFAFFALGRGVQAFINDAVWAVALIVALAILKYAGHPNVFWFVFVWGASAAVAAAVGPLQAGVAPRLRAVREWLSQQRDLGVRYLIEGTSNSAAAQFRNYGIGAILGLAVLGYLQAANTLMGPFQVVLYGMGLVALPEAVRILHRSPKHLARFCLLLSVALSLLALAWGVALLVALPRGLGDALLGPIWHHTYALILPSTLFVMGGTASAGAGTYMHAIGAARRSVRAAIYTSIIYVIGSLVGAKLGGAVGTMRGAAVATWIGAFIYWWELRLALREYRQAPAIEAPQPESSTDPSTDVRADTYQIRNPDDLSDVRHMNGGPPGPDRGALLDETS
jgi:O-antigen/teichoic acid export membrane protein